MFWWRNALLTFPDIPFSEITCGCPWRVLSVPQKIPCKAAQLRVPFLVRSWLTVAFLLPFFPDWWLESVQFGLWQPSWLMVNRTHLYNTFLFCLWGSFLPASPVVQGRRLFCWSPRGLSDFQPKFVPKVRGQEVRQLSGWDRLTGRRKSKKEGKRWIFFSLSYLVKRKKHWLCTVAR